ncbi:class I SAM-dependent methyltransferase [Nostoc sp. NZL]|uniref:class I SAM-dependent methyltransferase n=1 Tax=Nostoc sp. NZL TaxID=2650612 RepID=UPI0018C4B30B|nr:class I SAM-dependent methyltransferase [Nostoc sp. NZL]MBG1244651.1 class I SAM-dependent methyltransferase [Nostoc sp. NZL]
MGIKFEKILIWGRSAEEYTNMFGLTLEDNKLKIIDCAGGPASFNVEITRRGGNVVSCDPIYKLSKTEIARHIQEASREVMNAVQGNPDNFVWQDIQSPSQLLKIRISAMQEFIEDFSLGIQEKRYVTGELPTLPFADRKFDLALCSHFLFIYSEHLSEEFHIASIAEMCRVAIETRIFPLLDTSGKLSPFLLPVINQLIKQGYEVEIRQASYKFQKTGDKFLSVSKS